MKEVLIVGAGPTGLVLALWLNKQGVSVRIIDKSSGPSEASRALAVQARTLELYRQLGLAETLIENGHKNMAMNLWVRGKQKASISFKNAGAGFSPYPFLLIYPQDKHERLLVERLESLGIIVERQTELVSFEDKRDFVAARLRKPDDSEEICEISYLAGCDGARSTTRTQLGEKFEGGTYKHVFYVADVEVSGLENPDDSYMSLDSSDFVAVLSYGRGGSRLIGTVRDERAERAETLKFEDVSSDAIQSLGLRVNKVNWFSTYRVHHRLATNFRHERVFLLGDAAHIHSPAGGQGMNTGIIDSINLAWKLAAVLKGKAPDSLLDSYSIERQAFARTLVNTTDRIFSFVTKEGRIASFVRTRIAPLFINIIYRMPCVRAFMFKLISQTTMNYRNSPLSKGKVNNVRGGDRLPWVELPDSDNYQPLADIGWQMHVYGVVKQDLKTWCEKKQIVLRVFDWKLEYEKKGLTQDGAYLLRPDTYIAIVDAHQSTGVFNQYFNSLGFTFENLA